MSSGDIAWLSSRSAVLCGPAPTESATHFMEHRARIFKQWPSTPFHQEQIVGRLAGYTWRRNNLSIFSRFAKAWEDFKWAFEGRTLDQAYIAFARCKCLCAIRGLASVAGVELDFPDIDAFKEKTPKNTTSTYLHVVTSDLARKLNAKAGLPFEQSPINVEKRSGQEILRDCARRLVDLAGPDTLKEIAALIEMLEDFEGHGNDGSDFDLAALHPVMLPLIAKGQIEIVNFLDRQIDRSIDLLIKVQRSEYFSSRRTSLLPPYA